MNGLEVVLDRLCDTAALNITMDAPLGPLTTYRVGGRASALVVAQSQEDLRRIGEAVAAASGDGPMDLLVIGRGSNLLVADGGFTGIVVQLGDGLASIDVDDHSMIVGGGAALPVVARRSVAAGLTGFEWAVGVPGTIGGAVRMNAGGHGSDMAASVERVHVVDLRTGEDSTMTPTDLRFGYRHSSIGSEQVVVTCRLVLTPGDRSSGEEQLSEIVRWRREHQPGGANAGSVFRNPPGESAGRIIEQAGLKGFRVGTAEVSAKHANFIQADADGRAEDIARVMIEVRREVAERTGVDLHAETHLVGFDASVVESAGAQR
jgi:UDP-N-acetylmuramate dehydrogenase